VPTSVLAQTSLPDSVKEQFCRELLAEFGVTKIHAREPDGELICCCPLPWHDDRHPSAALNYRKLVFRCLSCDSGGGILWFIASCRGLQEREARKWLDGQTGFGAESNLPALLNLLDAIYATPKSRAVVPIPSMSTRVLDPWRVIHPYLTEVRHIPRQNIIRMQAGYAEALQISQDRTSERIILPHIWKGRLVGWQSRRLVKDGTPKYLSTEGFPADRTIYNFDPWAKTAVIVESPFSALRHCHHLPIEATFGAAVTDAQIKQLARHERVVLFMDNDLAGWRAVDGHWEDQKYGPPKQISKGIVERLQGYCDIRVVDNPWAADPGDMGDDIVRELVETAVPFAVWTRPQPESLKKWEGE